MFYISDSSSPMMAACFLNSALDILLSLIILSASDLVSVEASFDEIAPRAINTAINNSMILYFLVVSSNGYMALTRLSFGCLSIP